MICDEKILPKQQNVDSCEPLCVCFVCTGNTCRSPMAQAVANAMAHRALKALPEAVQECAALPVIAQSAGLYAVSGDPISQNAVLALEEAGIEAVGEFDYHKHTAQTLTEEFAERFDLLIGMSGSHTMELLMRYPHLAKKITCMPTPISDPFGGDLTRYKACLAEITDGVKKLLFSGRPI